MFRAISLLLIVVIIWFACPVGKRAQFHLPPLLVAAQT